MPNKTKSTAVDTPPAKWHVPVAPNTAALQMHDRAMQLLVAGSRSMQIDIDTVTLGVDEINLALPGIKIRIGL